MVLIFLSMGHQNALATARQKHLQGGVAVKELKLPNHNPKPIPLSKFLNSNPEGELDDRPAAHLRFDLSLEASLNLPLPASGSYYPESQVAKA